MHTIISCHFVSWWLCWLNGSNPISNRWILHQETKHTPSQKRKKKKTQLDRIYATFVSKKIFWPLRTKISRLYAFNQWMTSNPKNRKSQIFSFLPSEIGVKECQFQNRLANFSIFNIDSQTVSISMQDDTWQHRWIWQDSFVMHLKKNSVCQQDETIGMGVSRFTTFALSSTCYLIQWKFICSWYGWQTVIFVMYIWLAFGYGMQHLSTWNASSVALNNKCNFCLVIVQFCCMW